MAPCRALKLGLLGPAEDAADAAKTVRQAVVLFEKGTHIA